MRHARANVHERVARWLGVDEGRMPRAGAFRSASLFLTHARLWGDGDVRVRARDFAHCAHGRERRVQACFAAFFASDSAGH